MTESMSIQTANARRSSARLKVDLLSEGLVIADGVDDFLVERSKPRLRVRSGACGGLDLILPGDIYVNCPVDELFATASPYQLRRGGQGLRLVDTRDGREVGVNAVARPEYYSRHSERSGVALSQLGQVCSDRLGIGLTNGCTYWAPVSRCRFCSIGLNVRTGHEAGHKTTDDVVDVAEAALSDPALPATHVLLGGGTPAGPDAGAVAFADAARALKRRWPRVPVYVMIAPPRDRSYVEMLVEAGVDEIGINLEVWSDEAGQRYLPGKRAPGLDHYLAMLEAVVDAFAKVTGRAGPDIGRTRSIMIVGLESASDTLRGVEALASRGVMPILTPFRPMVGTDMERHPRWTGPALWDLTVAADEAARRYGMPLGPTCVPCQANTLNVPGHPAYRVY